MSSSSASATTAPPPLPWHMLPDDILCLIFKSLWLGDRVRASLVCKSWAQLLTQQDSTPKIPEAPWQILSNDSYSKPQPCLKEIHFRSLSEQRIYRFPLPPTGKRQFEAGWFLCGSSRGWLLLAGKETMFLWQPLSGDTRKLPPLSTLSFFPQLQMSGNLSSVVHRVQVFSLGRVDCIVAVIFRRTNTNSEIALCTPRGKTWKTLSGCGEFETCYSDILFRSETRSLWALATPHTWLPGDAQAPEDFMASQTIRLTGCRITVNKLVSPVLPAPQVPFPLGLQRRKCFHLVESALTNKIIVVAAAFLGVACMEGVDIEPDNNIVGFRRQETAAFELGAVDMDEGDEGLRRRQLETMSGIGEETVFVGASGSFSTPTVGGAEPNCVYFATDDAKGLALRGGEHEHDEDYLIHEHGVFSFEQAKMQQTSFKPVRCLSGSTIGWFTPQLTYTKTRYY